MQLGQRIKEIRKNNNLTQEEFSTIFHVTRQTVSNWENEKNYPDLFTLIEISDCFDVSLDKLLKEDIKMTRKLNNEIKWAKMVKKIISIIILLVVILMIIWYFAWSHNKTLSEETFQEGLAKYEYTVDETVYQGGYYIISYDKSTYFTLPNQTMPGYLDFATDFHAKDVDCYIEEDGNRTKLCWALYDGGDKLPEKIMLQEGKNEPRVLNTSEIEKYAEIIEFGTELYNSVYRES